MNLSLKCHKDLDTYGKNFSYIGLYNVKQVIDAFKNADYIYFLSNWITFSFFKHLNLIDSKEWSSGKPINNFSIIAEFRALHTIVLNAIESVIEVNYQGNESNLLKELGNSKFKINVKDFKEFLTDPSGKAFNSALQQSQVFNLLYSAIKNSKDYQELLVALNNNSKLNNQPQSQPQQQQQQQAPLYQSSDITDSIEYAFRCALLKHDMWQRVLNISLEQPNDLINVLLIGDSASAGVLLNKDELPWPDTVKRSIKKIINDIYGKGSNGVSKVEFINSHLPELSIESWSQSGAKLQDALNFLQAYPYKGSQTKFDAVIVGVGANDLYNQNLDVSINFDFFVDFYNKYLKIVQDCKQLNPTCKIIISAPIPDTKNFPNRSNYVEALNNSLARIAKLVPDVYFANLKDVIPKIDFGKDALHPASHVPITEFMADLLFKSLIEPKIKSLSLYATPRNFAYDKVLDLHENKHINGIELNKEIQQMLAQQQPQLQPSTQQAPQQSQLSNPSTDTTQVNPEQNQLYAFRKKLKQPFELKLKTTQNPVTSNVNTDNQSMNGVNNDPKIKI
jgi:hypothetical protein